MKQFAFEYVNQTQLAASLDRVEVWSNKNDFGRIWIQVYVMEDAGDCIQPIADTIDLCLPEAKYMITHAGMAFSSGSRSEALALVVCNVFENPNTKVELVQYDFSQETFEKTADDIIDYVNSNPWIKMMSINTGSNMGGIRYLNKVAAEIDQHIVISGGAAITRGLVMPAKLLSSDGHISTSPLIVTYIGGDDFHARTDVTVGWKGIGKEFTITKSEGALVSEIDGMPAFDIYRKYFKIDADPGMIVEKTIEFPLCFEDKGILFLRCPLLLNEDGSMVMMLDDLTEGRKVRLSFGSMDVILDEIAASLDNIAEFEPQVISVNSCIGRLFFWGDSITSETELFSKVSSSSGFLTGGEIIRRGDRMLILNETIVSTAMREGKRSTDGSGVHKVGRINKKYSLAHRLATFIETVTADLEQYNNMIERMAIIDELTGLYNRREIERIISGLIEEKKEFSLVMLDADNFKKINDTYGHKEGDRVLKLLSDMMGDTIEESGQEIYAGRWGGDEFLVAAVGSEAVAVSFAEGLQKRYNSETAYSDIARTLSIGIASTGPDISGDAIFQKADDKLYEAKRKGKGIVAR